MGKEKIKSGVTPEKTGNELLREMLEANRRKMESISWDMVQKKRELDKLKAEIEELNQIYTGNKRTGNQA